MAHQTWNVSDPVEVRSNNMGPWVAGTVTGKDAVCYQVTLNSPMTADAWLGMTRPRAGSSLVSVVTVMDHCSLLVPDVHIRTPV